MSIGEAAYLLGTPESYVRKLAKATLLPGKVSAGPNGEQIWMFEKEALDRVMHEYVAALPLKRDLSLARTTIYFSKACYRLQSMGLGPDDVLRAIRCGRLPAHRTNTSLKFSAIRLRRADVTAFGAELRSVQFVSYRQAQRLLHCKSGALRYLEAVGRLIPRQIDHRGKHMRRWYARGDIDSFKHHYVSAKEASSIIGCSIDRIRHWTRQGHISAVGGPGIDNWTHYWFDREQLVAWRRRLLRPREAQEILQVSVATIFRWVQKGILIRREGPFGGRRSWYVREQVEAVARTQGNGQSSVIAPKSSE